MRESRQPLLRIVDVTKTFGGVVALNDVSISADGGTIVGLIGPNGAGKTTLLNVINGVLEPDSGKVYLKDERIDGVKPYVLARKGVGRTFQVPRIFRRLTVIENVITPVIHRGKLRESVKDRARELLKFVRLAEKSDQYAGELSGGQQKLLEFARSLMPDPDLVLMDEPFAGVHPEIKSFMIERIKELNAKQGKTFVIVSHDMPVVSELCQTVIVMNAGMKLVEGEPGRVLEDERVVQAYLGG